MLERISKDVVLTDEYWDCECDDNYIHPVSQLRCDICGADQEDAPSSHYNEVIDAGLSVLQHNAGIINPITP